MNSEIGFSQCQDRETVDFPSNLLKIKQKLAYLRESTMRYKREITEIHNEIKVVEVFLDKYLAKIAKKKMDSKMSKKPSGFAAPVKISDVLCEFMGKEQGSLVSRTEATKFINKYIKENRLCDAENKTLIKPDAKLHSLLGTNDENEIKYFNIQKYLNVHFLK